jgi:hypothetical protein
MVGVEAPAAGGEQVPVPVPGEPLDADAATDGEVEAGRIGLQVVGDLVFAGYYDPAGAGNAIPGSPE